MPEPDQQTTAALLIIAAIMIAISLPLPYIAKHIPAWWWIALVTNINCAAVCGYAALQPTSRGVPITVGVAAFSWLVFYTIVLYQDTADYRQPQGNDDDAADDRSR